MQQPTCTNVRIRSTADAHKIFGSIQQGLLHMVTRRLDAEERHALRSGCVYAWEERGPHSEITGLGIERFTEGRRWSPSRVRDEFLFYYEKYTPPTDVNNNNNNTGNSSERQPPRDWDQLVKQTYSVWVETDRGRRKWHLTAYFTQATIDQLGTIDNIRRIRDVVVPEGTFKSTRVARRTRAEEENQNRTVAARTYAAFPSPPYQQHGTSNSNPVLMHEPYQQRQQQHRTDEHDYIRDQLEPLQPNSQRTPHLRETSNSNSPPPAGTTTSGGQYYGDVPYYSGPSSRAVRSNSYIDHPTTNHPHGDSPYSPQQYPSHPTRAHTTTTTTSPQNYSSSNPILSPPWGNHDSYYYTRPIHSGPSSPPSAQPSSYNYSNNHHHHHHHISSSSSSSQHANSSYTKSYTPSYSLESALTPPPRSSSLSSSSSSTLDRRGLTLASLQIPHSHYYTTTTQCHTPPDSAIAMEDPSSFSSSKEGGGGEDQSGLAPLDELKRSRYRREPLDEKTLRLLISGQSSSSSP